MENLSHKHLIMLVAPSAMGKSSILDEVVHQNPGYSRVRSFTTRARRDIDEPNQYYYFSEEEIDAKEAAGEVITRTKPTPAGDTYGTLIESYSTDTCFLDAISYSVEQYRFINFASTTTITLTAPYDEWRTRFIARYPQPSEDAMKHLEEARNSIGWSLGDKQTKWLINDGTIEDVARRLVTINQKDDAEHGREMARKILSKLLVGDIWS